jgi:DNA repair photolyase
MYARLVIGAVFVALMAAGLWKVHHLGIVKGRAQVHAEWDREKLRAIEKREVNRDTARKAEIRYVDREIVRTEYLTATKEEMRHETTNLESCRLDAGDISVLNKAAGAARQD